MMIDGGNMTKYFAKLARNNAKISRQLSHDDKLPRDNHHEIIDYPEVILERFEPS